jgi:hypothetical protein
MAGELSKARMRSGGETRFEHALLQRDGRISAVDLNRLQGLLLVGGAVFQAYTARYLREAGHTVTRGEHGDAQIVGVDKDLQRQFSKRHEQAEAAAKELAAKQARIGRPSNGMASRSNSWPGPRQNTGATRSRPRSPAPRRGRPRPSPRVSRCRNACAVSPSLN